MIVRDSEYIRQAEYCRNMADRTADYDQKEAWLHLAAKWLLLTHSAAAAAALTTVEIGDIFQLGRAGAKNPN